VETIGYGTNWIDTTLWIWFALTAVSVAYVAWDLFTRTPEMKVMKWGWILVTLYTGIFAVVVYWFSCREPAPGTHEKFIAPLWKQSRIVWKWAANTPALTTLNYYRTAFKSVRRARILWCG